MDVSRQTLRVQKQNKEDTYNFQEVLWRAHLGKPGKADPDKKKWSGSPRSKLVLEVWDVRGSAKNPWTLSLPIGSMYSIYANMWGILMVNVTIYSTHGSYGLYALWFSVFFAKFVSQISQAEDFQNTVAFCCLWMVESSYHIKKYVCTSQKELGYSQKISKKCKPMHWKMLSIHDVGLR